MKQIKLLYFAQLGAQAGNAEESLSTELDSLEALFDDRKTAHGWDLSVKNIRFARNDDFCSASDRFHDGDVIAFMPPMSGG
ncbi:MAG: MoaD/ThiS family protein [Verrucomicrobiota bacterium]